MMDRVVADLVGSVGPCTPKHPTVVHELTADDSWLTMLMKESKSRVGTSNHEAGPIQ